MIFLIEYDRRAGRVERLCEFLDTQRREAQNERLRLELSLRGEPDRELVLLDAPDLDQLRQTHRRYFDGGLKKKISLKTFVQRAADALREFESSTRAKHKKEADFPLRRDEDDWWRELAAFVELGELVARLDDVVKHSKNRDRSRMS